MKRGNGHEPGAEYARSLRSGGKARFGRKGVSTGDPRGKRVLLDGGAKGNTEKAITDACAFHKIPLVKTPEFELGDAIGKPGRMVVAVADPRFAERILQLMSAQESD